MTRPSIGFEDAKRLAYALFDRDYYSSTYRDAGAHGIDIYEHYVTVGWRQGKNPSAGFDTEAYLAQNPEVRSAGICPLIHYVSEGITHERNGPAYPEQLAARRRSEKYFDPNYYVTKYPDVLAAGVNPLNHYLEIGWREGRNPSDSFDTRYYLETYKDVQDMDICPLVHYALTGASEGRTTKPVDVRRRIIETSEWRWNGPGEWKTTPEEPPLDSANIKAFLAERGPQFRNGIVLSISHDDYATVCGGVQNCVGDEEQAFSKEGWAYFHFRPAQPLLALSEDTPVADFLTFVRVNGQRLGLVRFLDLVAAIAAMNENRLPIFLVIHHLLGFSPEVAQEAARIAKPKQTIVWAHDFFTLCPSYALLRNNLEFCFAPDATSKVCGICCFGERRRSHLRRMEALFSAVVPTLLTPSEAALTFWQSRSGMRISEAAVVPHGSLTMDARGEARNASEPLKVGFLGLPTHSKGWHTFENLAARHYGDQRYAFFHLGFAPGTPARNIHYTKVEVDRTKRDEMIYTVRSLELDVVVLWSYCYETFSFTAHEALAGGAFVVTRRDAGNVWPAIFQAGGDRGCALETEAELLELFETGRISGLAKERRYGDFQPAAATASYLLQGH